jgi:hypothetical protein
MMRVETQNRDNLMSEFMQLDTEAPATMKAVVEAVLRLSTYSERQILELVSEGRLGELFPFHPRGQETPPDFVAEDDLQEASALPLSRERKGALIQSSMPTSDKLKSGGDVRLRPASRPSRTAQKKSFHSSED